MCRVQIISSETENHWIRRLGDTREDASFITSREQTQSNQLSIFRCCFPRASSTKLFRQILKAIVVLCGGRRKSPSTLIKCWYFLYILDFWDCRVSNCFFECSKWPNAELRRHVECCSPYLSVSQSKSAFIYFWMLYFEIIPLRIICKS